MAKRHTSETVVLTPPVPSSVVEQIDRDIDRLRIDVKLRESVAVRAAYAFGEWPPEAR